jgi:hypothetical protein
MNDKDSKMPKDDNFEVNTSDNTAHVDIQPTKPNPPEPPSEPPSGHYIHEIPTFPIPTYVVNDDPSDDPPHDDLPEEEDGE